MKARSRQIPQKLVFFEEIKCGISKNVAERPIEKTTWG